MLNNDTAKNHTITVAIRQMAAFWLQQAQQQQPKHR